MMYKIAGVYVEMFPKYERLINQSKAYLTESDSEPDIIISINDSAVKKVAAENPLIDLADSEYMIAGAEFYSRLIHFNGIMLHGSAVALDGEVYVFTAPSGTGKSTHTGLWLDHFGERAEIINDDKPALRFIDGRFYAFGTPFSGKYDISKNIGLPLKAISIIERGVNDEIARVSKKDAYYGVLNQTIRPFEKADYLEVLNIVDNLVSMIPIYNFKATVSDNAVITAYEGMNK